MKTLPLGFLTGLVAVATLAVTSNPAKAATSTWQNSGTDWNTSANWSAGLPAAGLANGALFDTAATVNPNISASVTVGTLQFSTTASSGYTISSSSEATTLTLNSYGTSGVFQNWAISAANTSGTNTISAPIILAPASGSALLFGQASGGTLNISGSISGTAGLRLVGGGTINISGTGNSYSGGTIIAKAATVSVASLGNTGANGSLGTGVITVGSAASVGGTSNTAGTLRYQGAGETTDKITTLGYDATLDTTGATGGLTLSSDLTSSAASRTLTLTGDTTGNVISGSIVNNTATKLTKTGTGTWTLSGTNTYSGVTTINAGTLLVDGSLAATSAVSVNNGGRIGGLGSVGAVTFNTGAALAYDIASAAQGGDGLTATSFTGAGLSSFTIYLTGAATGFASAQDYQWEVLSSASVGSISLAGISIDATGFGPAVNGSFSVSKDADSLFVNYTAAIPEPSTYAIIAGGALLGFAVWRRRS